MSWPTLLDDMRDVAFLASITVIIAESIGYDMAESRHQKMIVEYAAKGEQVPEEIVPPRNLIPEWGRQRMRRVLIAGTVIVVACSVGLWLVK